MIEMCLPGRTFAVGTCRGTVFLRPAPIPTVQVGSHHPSKGDCWACNSLALARARCYYWENR